MHPYKGFTKCILGVRVLNRINVSLIRGIHYVLNKGNPLNVFFGCP